MFVIDRKMLIIILISFINAFAFTLVLPVLYEYGTFFGFSAFEISLLLSIFAFSQFVTSPILGKLSDKYGRKPVLAITLFGTYLSNIMAYFAPSGFFLLIARSFDGITSGNNSVAQAVISDITKQEDRPKAFGLFGGAIGFAFVFGPLVSIVLQKISINVPFLGSAFLALLGTFLTLYLLPETNSKRENNNLTLSNIGITKIFEAFKYKQYNTYIIHVFFSSLAFGIFLIAIQPHAINTLKIGSTGIGMILFIFGVVSILGQVVLVPKGIKKFGFATTQMVSTGATAILFFMMPLSNSLLYFFIILAVFSITSFVYRQITTSLITINSKKEDSGIAIGLLEAYYNLGASFGPIIGGLTLHYVELQKIEFLNFSPTVFPFFLSAFVTILLLIYIYIKRDKFKKSKGKKQDL